LLLILAAAASAQPAASGRYIVELEGEPALRSRDVRARRVEIRTQQRSVERQVVQRGWRVEASVQTVANAIIAEGDPALLPAIAALRGVRRITPEKDLQLALDRAKIIHRIEEAWSRLTEEQGGPANAGRGLKIAILDTGIEPEHPGFSPEDMTTPEGYPQVSGGTTAVAEQNRGLTNAKIIVARSYDAYSARDLHGHGTAVAMAAAGVRHEGPTGPISGIAPRAWLGAYRVSRAETGAIPNIFVLRALEDAAVDGMDVINCSFGFVGLAGPAEDPVAFAMRVLSEWGVIVVCAAGNDGPGMMTVDDSAADGKVIAVGASTNDRIPTTPAVIPESGAAMAAIPASNSDFSAPIEGEIIDVEPFDGASSARGLACAPLDPGSLPGAIALIRRGECAFAVKIENARNAGAVAAVVYNRPDDADPESLLTMNVDANPTLMALFVGHSDGLRLKALSGSKVFLRFFFAPGDINRIATFSSLGPAVDLAIKPDLVAVGAPLVTAAIAAPSELCPICDPSGYTAISGTSFAAPLVSGAAAVLLQARPGLSGDDYRSLLVNGAVAVVDSSGLPAPVMTAGAGRLDLVNSLNLTVVASPVSLSFGGGEGTIDSAKALMLKNIGTETATYTFAAEGSEPAPLRLSDLSFTLAPGEVRALIVTLAAGGLEPGAYQGFVLIRQEGHDAVARVPYWYAVRAPAPASIEVVGIPSCVAAGGTVTLYARFFDSAGLQYGSPGTFGVETTTTGAAVLDSGPIDIPMVYRARLRLGPTPGANTFVFRSEGLTTTVNVRGAQRCN
jgi:subtilisin family serine protease